MSLRLALFAGLALSLAISPAMATDPQRSPRLVALPVTPELCRAYGLNYEACRLAVRTRAQAGSSLAQSTPATAGTQFPRKVVARQNNSSAPPAVNPALLAAFGEFIKWKRCDSRMDRCYDSCEAGGTAPSQCNRTCTVGTQCGGGSKQTYGEYIDQQIEALAANPAVIAKAD
jgi:hypothetical protein